MPRRAQSGHRPGPSGHRPGPSGRRPGPSFRHKSRAALLRLLGQGKKRKAEKAAAFESQAAFANSTGRNRTPDYSMPSSVGSKAVGQKGPGKWKKWTPEAVLRTAFASENAAVRQVAEQVDGGSASHSALCKLFVAGLIFKQQEAGFARFLEQHEDGLEYALTNMMFDETELEINLHEVGLGAWSILASHSQMTFKEKDKDPVDFDFIRVPVALPNKQAATMWPALCAGEGGLWPGLSDVRAKLRAVLVTCDAAPANLKLLGHLTSVVDAKTLVLPFLCLQHRTGNVIERATKLLGTLTGSYAVAKTLRSGAVVRKLTANVRSILAQKLVVVDQVPPGLEGEWATGRVVAKKILELALGCDDENDQAGIGKEFLQFFGGPWTGPGFCVFFNTSCLFRHVQSGLWPGHWLLPVAVLLLKDKARQLQKPGPCRTTSRSLKL